MFVAVQLLNLMASVCKIKDVKRRQCLPKFCEWKGKGILILSFDLSFILFKDQKNNVTFTWILRGKFIPFCNFYTHLAKIVIFSPE